MQVDIEYVKVNLCSGGIHEILEQFYRILQIPE